jgi:predicted glycosyltransferase
MIKVLYVVEPMIGIGPNVDANLIAKQVVANFPDIEMKILMDSQAPLKYQGSNIGWIPTETWRYNSLNGKLYNLDGVELTEDFKENRVNQFLKIVEKLKPDVLLLHNYLSGSKWDSIIDFEMLPLIEKARELNPDLKVYSYLIGMIDSFENMSEAESKAFAESVEKNIDKILLRSDNPELFFKTCEPARQFKNKFIPVGYSADTEIPNPIQSLDGVKEVVVSAGGSDLGLDLFLNVIEAFALAQSSNSALSKYNWRIFVGPMQTSRINTLQEKIDSLYLPKDSSKIILQSNTDSETFLAHLCHHCELSISQCGQRTFSDLEIAGVPSLVIPRESQGKEFEQIYRAKYMEEAKRSILLREQDLNPNSLFQSAEMAFELGGSRLGIRMDGPENLLKIIYSNTQI